jgi:hypothetical protein
MRQIVQPAACAGLLATLLMGCAKQVPEQPAPFAPGSEVGVRIVSHHWNDVVIRCYHDGVWERLGTAGAVQVTNFFIPWRKVATGGTLRFEADPVSGAEPVYTDNLLLQPGQLIVWTLEGRLEQSSVGVY